MTDEEKNGSKEIVDVRYRNFYEQLRERIHTWLREKGVENKHAEYILMVPDFFYLLVRLMQDERVPVVEKVKLGAVIAYFIMPFDLIPEVLFGPVGFADDLALSAFVINGLLLNIDPVIILENWPGEGNVLELVKDIIARADELVGSGLVKKLKKIIGN